MPAELTAELKQCEGGIRESRFTVNLTTNNQLDARLSTPSIVRCCFEPFYAVTFRESGRYKPFKLSNISTFSEMASRLLRLIPLSFPIENCFYNV
jgi:hypothetical protein